MSGKWKRDEDLPALVEAIEEDPSIQLDLLTETDNQWHDLDPQRHVSQERFPFEAMRPFDLATQSIQMLVLNKVKSRLGEHEDSRGRSLAGIWYGDRVRNSAFDTAPWCDMLAGQVMGDVGGEELLKAVGCFALTTAHAQFLYGKGVTNRPAIFSVGALVFQNWDLNGTGNGNLGKIDHVEFVERDNTDGTITTVGGNVNNGIYRRVRSRQYAVVQAEWWKLFTPAGGMSKAATDDWYLGRHKR
jgi:hypothetical protein